MLLLLPRLLAGQALRGQVQDQDNRAIPYASVARARSSQGTTADENGRFALAGLPAGSHRLQVSAVGYAHRYAQQWCCPP